MNAAAEGGAAQVLDELRQPMEESRLPQQVKVRGSQIRDGHDPYTGNVARDHRPAHSQQVKVQI